MWQIAVVGQPEGMMWVGSDLQFCVGYYWLFSKELEVWMRRTVQVRRRMTFWRRL